MVRVLIEKSLSSEEPAMLPGLLLCRTMTNCKSQLKLVWEILGHLPLSYDNREGQGLRNVSLWSSGG